MNRVYFHWTEREEFSAGMWRKVDGEARHPYQLAAADLMRNPSSFEAAMDLATKQWPKSTEAALTAESINRRAWLGHAGCCIALGSPEDITRAAWNTLSPLEQDAANAAADRSIEKWLASYNA